MRWFRRAAATKGVERDPEQQRMLIGRIREEFRDGVAYPKQVEAVMGLLAGDDGLAVGARVVRDVGDEAQAAVVAQGGRRDVVDRANYRPVWRTAGPGLRSPLFGLAC